MPELKIGANMRNMRWAIAAASGGCGLALGIAGIEALKSHPEFLPQLMNGGVLGFAALIVGMLLFREEFKNFNSVQERNVIAQERLAANVGAFVEKDDRRAEAQEAATRYLAGRTDLILEKLGEIQDRMK